MNEFFARERLSAYIDGELSASERNEVDAALKRSPELRDEYERLLGTVDFMREHGSVQAPPDFHTRVLAAVADEPMPGGFWLKIKGFFTAVPMESLAVAVAAILVAVLVGSNMDDTPPIPETEPIQVAALDDETALVGAELPKTAPELTAAAPPESTGAAKKDGGSDWAEQMAGVVLGGEQPKDDRAASVAAPKMEAEDGIVQLEPAASEPAATDTKDIVLEPERKSQLEASQSMQLHVSDPDSLRQLLNIVYRFDGTVTDSKGRQVDEDALVNGASKVGLRILLPQENVTQFSRAIAQIGEVNQTSYNDQMLYSADQKVGVYVEVIAPVSKSSY